MQKWICLVLPALLVFLAPPALSAPTIGPITAESSTSVGQYEIFEAFFDITATSATNFYYPYDASPPPGVDPGVGITVDALLLPPGQSNWANALTLPCFRYQPVEEAGSGNGLTFLPVGNAHWRFRFAPEVTGTWQYMIRATDAGGTSESAAGSFDCVTSGHPGFVRISPTDPRWFEFSDGTPFVTPLLNAETGNPLNGLEKLRARIPHYDENGVRFIRWFCSDEGANYAIFPYGGNMRVAWGFGDANVVTDADTAAGKRFSFKPYPYTGQSLPAVNGATYQLTLRAKVTAPSELEIGIRFGGNRVEQVIGDTGGWQDFVLTHNNSGNSGTVNARLVEKTAGGTIRLHSLVLRRDTTGNGDWTPNLLAHPDPDSYAYIDQRHAAMLDEVLDLSVQHRVYHKLTINHKNDAVLGRFNPDGSINSSANLTRFYSGANQAGRWYQEMWYRYFVARWSAFTSLHSVELANENDPWSTAGYDAAYALADTVNSLSPRKVLISNSFWHSFPLPFWSDSRMDYGDQHGYLNNAGGLPPSSPFLDDDYNDSVRGTRQCYELLKGFGLNKPVLRGETGVFDGGWMYGWYPPLTNDTQALYDKKKLWAHVGIAGHQSDGEWYTNNLSNNDNWIMYRHFNAYMAGEPVANGHHEDIGTDLSGAAGIAASSTDVRGFGLRDTVTTSRRGIARIAPGRALLWIDNSHHTWRKVVDGASIPSVTGTLTLGGFPSGQYNLEWWVTDRGRVTHHSSTTPDGSGNLAVSVENLAADVAVKINHAGTDPPSLSFTAPESTGGEWQDTAKLAVRLAPSSSSTVSVAYAAVAGTAEAATDYVLASGTLTFAPGEVEKFIDVELVDDGVAEPDETVEIVLMDPINALVAPAGVHTLTILDSAAASARWQDYR